MKPPNILLAALLTFGLAGSASAQFRIFDPEINRRAGECAATGNCTLNNVEMNTLDSGSNYAQPYSYEQEQAHRKELERQDYERRVLSAEVYRSNHPPTKPGGANVAPASTVVKPVPKRRAKVAPKPVDASAKTPAA